ncbi:C4-dicarboxylate transporter, DctQ subunit [Gracilibacillus orientalis]|uniref:C4-dicarboxylate transporter, DctQ subunit n=1 Tax=Gracilibacillus orientalis TaxID=334253 RepID=A0A1I4HV14_9BACI|nr:TRAP transporter small permease [Gracilibacillus orientalis]SFL46015.1 C4-dicarboxylate transporter, DctQ subunit [Gracilibacillus orientalis]
MKKFNQVVNHIEESFAVFSMIVASILIFVQVILRYLFNFSLIWSEETARFLVIWLVLIGSSIAVREKGHATVDALVAFLPSAGKKFFSIFANLAGIVFCLIMILAGSEMVSSVVELGNVTPALGVPMAIPYLTVPVGGGLMLFRFVQMLVVDVKRSYSDDQGQPEEVMEK